MIVSSLQVRSWEGHCASIRVHCGVTSLTRYLTSLCLGFLVCKMGTVIPAPLTCSAVELNEIKGVNCLGVFSFFILCAPKPQWEHQEEFRFFQFPTCWESTEETKHKLDSAVCPRQWEPEDPRTQSILGALSLGWQFQVRVHLCVCVRNAKTMGPVSQSPAIGPVAENLPSQSHPSPTHRTCQILVPVVGKKWRQA